MAETFRIDVVVSGRTAEAQIAGIDRSLASLNRTASSTNLLLRNAFAVAGITSLTVFLQRAISQVTAYADSFTSVQNRLRIVTSGTEDLAVATDRLLGISNDTRTSFEATAQLFARTALATRNLGVEQSDLLTVTQAVNQAIILSGASTKEASNGLIQLAQGIAANRLGGDELRSVLEQLPVVADVIAKQLGVTRAELRELGMEGSITGKVIVDAFLRSAPQLAQDFANTVPTVSQAIQVLNNNVTVFIGRLNEATGASRIFAESLTFIGRNLQNIVSFGAAIAAALSVAPLIRFAQGLFDAERAARALQSAVAVLEKSRAGQEAFLGQSASQLEAQASLEVAAGSVERAQAALLAARAEGQLALVSFEATEAAQVQAAAGLRLAAANLRQSETALVAARSEVARVSAVATTVGEMRLLEALQERVAAAEAARAVAAGALQAAETRLNETMAAGNALRGQRAAQDARLAGLEANLATQLDRLSGAQTRLNAATAASVGSGFFAQARAFALANPFGIAAVSALALTAALGGIPPILDVIENGVAVIGGAFEFLANTVRSFRAELPALSQGVILVGTAVSSIVLGFTALAATNPFLAIGAAVGAVILALGTLRTAFAEIERANDILDQSINIAPIGQRILQIRQDLAGVNREIERSGPTPDLIRRQMELNTALARQVQLARERQGTDAASRNDEFERATRERIRAIQDEIQILGQSAGVREVEFQVLKERIRLERELKRALTETETERIRLFIRARGAAEELADVVDRATASERAFRRDFLLINKALDQGRINAEQASGLLNKLFEDRRQQNPLRVALADINRELDALRKTPAQLLPDAQAQGDPVQVLQRANREREIQLQVEKAIEQAKGSQVSSQEIIALREQLTTQSRRLAVEREIAQIREARASARRDLDAQQQLALLSDVERQIQEQVNQATQQLQLGPRAAEEFEALTRRNVALQELGGILNGLQAPALAQQQAQAELARQVAITNEQFAAGNLTVEQYATLMEELDFRVREASTSFTDGFTVALDKMLASINEAALGQQAFTSAINAAGEASAMFVRQGTVDFRQLALNIIAEISRILTQLLILRAVQAATGTGGIPTTPTGGSLVPFTGLGQRAAGGPVEQNRPYIVGERGPELFVPGRSGTVVPNDRVAAAVADSGRGGSAPVTVMPPQVNLTVVNVEDPEAPFRALESPRGGRTVINHMGKNPQSARRAIGQ